MNKTLLFLFSATGLLVVNNLFLYWIIDFSFDTFKSNTIGIALFIEAFMLMFLLAYYFKHRPIGKYKWYWLIILSLLGSLLFALPFYYWLNTKDKN